MIVKSAEYKNFRCIENEVFTPCEGINVISGQNAGGKTTFLEGIYIFARGKSHRTAHDTEMIKIGAEFSDAVLNFETGERKYGLEMAYSPRGRRICRKNGVEIRRLSEFVGCFRAVLFCPPDLMIVKGGPAARRAFLDTAIAQIKPGYIAALQRFNSVLFQRNSLIKNYFKDRASFDDTIDLWSAQLASASADIAKQRGTYVKSLSRHCAGFLSDMTGGKEKLSLEYPGQCSEEEYLEKLTVNREREIRAQATLFGAHREDVTITLNGLDARAYCSQGQQRSIAMTMKLSEGEICREQTGEYPVFLFDDILSELDEGRREYLINGISGRQVILTTCDENIAKSLGGAHFRVSSGKIER